MHVIRHTGPRCDHCDAVISRVITCTRRTDDDRRAGSGRGFRRWPHRM